MQSPRPCLMGRIPLGCYSSRFSGEVGDGARLQNQGPMQPMPMISMSLDVE